MRRTTIFLPDDLEAALRETARRTRRPQAQILREALTAYLAKQARPWPQSVGLGQSGGASVSSENVKIWIREGWRAAEPSEEPRADA